MSETHRPEPICEALSRRRLLGATTVAIAAGALADIASRRRRRRT